MQADLLLQREVGCHFWSALPLVPAQVADNSPAEEPKAGCVIPVGCRVAHRARAAAMKWAGDRLSSFCYAGKLQTVGDSWFRKAVFKKATDHHSPSFPS